MKKIPRQITIISLIVFIGLIYLFLTLQTVNSQKITWGVKAADCKLGGNNPQTAQRILKEKWDNFIDQKITFRYQEKSWPTNLVDLGFQIDEQATINQAYQIGRQSNIFINFKEQLVALMAGYHLEPSYTTDPEQFQEQTSELFKDIERPAQNASLIFDEEIDDFLLQHSSEGITIDRKRLLSDLSERIKSFSNQPINLDLVFDYPKVKNNEVDSARQKAQQILAGRPYQLTFEGRYWTINKEILIDWIKFPVRKEFSNGADNQILGLLLDEQKINDYLSEIAITIDQPTVNAQLKTEDNQATLFSPGQTGFSVKKQETINQLIADILAEPSIKKTTILAGKALPKITLKQTNKLGIDTLIGQGISNFAGSPKNRIHNIKIGTAKFNGLILNPGQEFSFNNLLGGSGPEQGFLSELVIKKDKTVPEYGGGLCQVSTTFFRTAVNAGLEITQRTPHAFPVEYYSPQGFDATVYEPYPDLRFINNTPAHLLIEGLVKDSQLIFNFYGTDDGRQVKIKGPYILEKKEDGSMKTVLTQEIHQNRELISEQTFYSNYKSPDLYPIETTE